ncbi:hypothetical protein Btru_009897 [Bulinus truncatus]|nr:hypothetical protein Btru_009897 [Bulinus truncatus]
MHFVSLNAFNNYSPLACAERSSNQEMFLIQIIVIIELFGSVNCVACSFTSWWSSFDSKGQSKCQEGNYYIRGFERNNVNWRDDALHYLEGVECCSAPAQWSNIDVLVIYADWTLALDNNNKWAFCPSGYFLQGLYRSDNGWPYYKGYLNNLESARCVKPSTHPFFYDRCYEEDISSCFDKKGRCSCKEGFYVTGIYRGNDDDLYNLDKLRCCKMATKPQEVSSTDNLKTRIMDTTLWRMANLAYMLGYGWCLGNRGLNVGEDFEKNKDTWEASKQLFWPERNCEGFKCDQRLSLEFGNWGLAVKDIRYGDPVFDDLKPETIDSGTIYNKEASPSSKSFEITKTVQETITHTTTNSFTVGYGLEFTVKFDIPSLGGASATSRYNFEFSTASSYEKSTQNSKTLTISTSKTVQPYSAAKYGVIMSKSRTTIPYTAVIIAKFSTQFRGFLRWGQGYSSPITNYHYKHKGSGDRPTVNYSFGSPSVPFYEALKKESESQSEPWLWNEMLQNYPSAGPIIKSLTDETQYEFKLSGTLQKVEGTKVDVLWETVNLTKHATMKRSTPKLRDSKETILAAPGPNDPPAKVKYPVVSLPNAEAFEFKAIPLDTNAT